jgi:hypothetical protein
MAKENFDVFAKYESKDIAYRDELRRKSLAELCEIESQAAQSALDKHEPTLSLCSN